MMFFVSNTSGYFNSFGETFYLEPVQYPNVNITNILVVENTLGKRFKNASSHIFQATFDENKIPNFPCPMPEPNQVPDHSSIIILRGGGIGDLIMLIPALRILKKILPQNVKLYLATLKEKRELFKGTKEIEKVMTIPTRMSSMIGMNYYLEFSNHYSLFKKEHMTDFYIALMGISYGSLPNAWKEPSLNPENTLSKKINSWFQEKRGAKAKIVYLHLGATDVIRRLPFVFAQQLAKQMPDVTFVMSSKSNPGTGNCADNIFFLNTENSLSDYITAIYCSDAVVSSDSSAYHIAAALKKPAVAVFGPIASSLRTAYSPTVKSFDAGYAGKTCTSPCGIDAVTQLRPETQAADYNIADGCPEASLKKTVYSPCLLSISTDKIKDSITKCLADKT